MYIFRIFVFMLPILGMGQKNFAPMNAIWHYEGHEIDCKGNHITYAVESEVEVNGKNCSVIYGYTGSDISAEFTKSSDSLIVWEDNSKVYFLEDSTFYLLFDFGANLGDTITFYEPINKSVFSSLTNNQPDFGPNENSILITNIDSIMVPNIPLKRYTYEIILSNGNIPGLYSIIENIGSTSHRFTVDHASYVADGCFGGLQCYTNQEVRYKTDERFTTPHPECDLTDSSLDLNLDKSLLLYPNPVNDILHFETDADIKYVLISNIKGQTKTLQTTGNQISCKGWPKGIYIFSFVTDHGVFNNKVFVD